MAEQTHRNFLDYVQAFGQAFETKEQKDQFIATFAGGDKDQEKSVKQFLKNNFDRPLTPRWALKDTKFRTKLEIARRLWKGQSAEAATDAPADAEAEEPTPSNRNGKRVRIAETVEIYNPNAPDQEEEPAPKKKTTRKPAKKAAKKGQEMKQDEPVEEAAEWGEGDLQIVEQEDPDTEDVLKKTARKQAKGKKAPARGKKTQAKAQEEEEAEVMDLDEPPVLQQEEPVVEQVAGVEEGVPEQDENDAPPKKVNRRATKGKKASRGKKAKPEAEEEVEEEAAQNLEQKEAAIQEIVEQVVEQDQQEESVPEKEAIVPEENEDDAPPPKETARIPAKRTSARGKKTAQNKEQTVEEEAAVEENEEEAPVLEQEESANEEAVEEEQPKKAARRTAKRTSIREKKAAGEEEVVAVFGEDMQQGEPAIQQEVQAAVIEHIPEDNETGAAPEDPEIAPAAPIAQQPNLTELTFKINEFMELFQQNGSAMAARIEAKLNEMIENSRRQTELYEQNKDLLEEMFAYIKENNVQTAPPVPPRAATPYDQVAEQENQAPGPVETVLQVKRENVEEVGGQEKVVRQKENIRVKEKPITSQVAITDRLIKPSLIPRAARAFK